jgi:hypothetical protein
MKRPFLVLTLSALVFAVTVLRGAACAQGLGPTLDLRPGQEVTFPVAIADGHIALGPPRVSKPGAVEPKDGEISVSVVKNGFRLMPI